MNFTNVTEIPYALPGLVTGRIHYDCTMLISRTNFTKSARADTRNNSPGTMTTAEARNGAAPP